MACASWNERRKTMPTINRTNLQIDSIAHIPNCCAHGPLHLAIGTWRLLQGASKTFSGDRSA